MKDKKKLFNTIEIVVIIIFLLLLLGALFVQLIDPTSPFSVWIKNNVWDIERTLAAINSQVPVIIQSAIYIVIIYAVSKVVRLGFKKMINKSTKKKGIYTLLDGVVKYASAIAIILFILKALGVDTKALVASVGVLTLIVGIAAQPLLSDIIAGIFIIFEDEYSVGEIVTIGDFRGAVIEIGIRSTKILDAAGNIKIINNNDISDVINLSRELSLSVIDVDFPYDVPLEVLENLINNNLDKWKETIPGIVEGPYYKGVCSYKDSNITVKIVAKAKEEDKYQVERDLLREYRKMLKENNIDIAYPQVVINYPEQKEIELSKSQKSKAERFVSAQREASCNLEEQQRE